MSCNYTSAFAHSVSHTIHVHLERDLPHCAPSDAPLIGILFHTYEDGKENSAFASRGQSRQTARGNQFYPLE